MNNQWLQEFSKRVLEGFQVTPIWHQGFIRDDGRHVISHLIFELFCLPLLSCLRVAKFVYFAEVLSLTTVQDDNGILSIETLATSCYIVQGKQR